MSVYMKFYPYKSHAGKESIWGKKFKPNEVLGVAADLRTGKLLFSHNGSWKAPMGVAFEGLDAGVALFPALSGGRVNCVVAVNFGDRSMKYGPPDESYLTVWEVTRKKK